MKTLQHNKQSSLILYFLQLWITALFLLFQYYEMSYGLNIEMHKQVSQLKVCRSLLCSVFPQSLIIPPSASFWLTFFSALLNTCFQKKSIFLFALLMSVFWWTSIACLCCVGVNKCALCSSLAPTLILVCPSPSILPSFLCFTFLLPRNTFCICLLFFISNISLSFFIHSILSPPSLHWFLFVS